MVKKIVIMVAGLMMALALALPTTAKAEDGMATITGSLTSIDPKGMHITVQVNRSTTKTYYINSSTLYRKNSGVVDISEMYVGDIVSLTLVNPATSLVKEVMIQSAGTQIENVYRGTITSVNSAMNRLTVRNEQPLEDWEFGFRVSDKQTTAAFQSRTPIYVGNKKIAKTSLKKYINSDIYYVTTKQFGKEVIQQMIVREANERTYYEPMLAVDTRYKFIELANVGKTYFHDGTILVRNGRLIKPTGLTVAGQVYAVTDGHTRNNFIQVAQVMHDSFTSANFAGHELYFGRLDYVANNYLLEMKNVVKYEHNRWAFAEDGVLSFSNTTTAKASLQGKQIMLKPEMDLVNYEGEYGYFYVKNGHVQAVQLLDQTQKLSTVTAVGRVMQPPASGKLDVKDVAQWQAGSFVQSGRKQNMMIADALILKGGKVIAADQIQANDRVVVLSDGNFDVAVVLVD
ncbi:hypothetical protein BN1050_00293 [Metalysinibacillus saudimassiliensis]|uniref:Uncharacterized protein n=1 Tax=Metalysinibacillus saudimassiliensis TaxID=1461583 RepID=A0A078M0K4_9BACL|nr:hypothetical protein BN1050_00293 [Metalysinibacillus saudimassiliensis]